MLQIQKQRKKEMRKLGHMVPYYTLMECTMVASPILAAIASFLTFAAIADPSQFTPGAIFSAVALFGILRPPVEELPHAMVEVGYSFIAYHQRKSAIGKLCTGMIASIFIDPMNEDEGHAGYLLFVEFLKRMHNVAGDQVQQCLHTEVQRTL